MAFASLTIDLNARIANIERDMGRAAHVAEKQSQRIGAAFAKAGQAAAFLAGALGVGSFAGFIKSSIDAADNLNDLSKKTGIAVDNLAGLQLVVDKSGTTMEMLGGGVAKLNKTLGEAARGSQEAQTVLRDLGITASDPMEAFYQLADAFGRFRTEGDKASAMSRVIGKTWGELAPALAEGGAGLRAMVEEGKRLNPVTKEMAEQADKFNDALSRFKAEATGVGTAIATSLIPAMNDMLTRWNDAIRLSGQHGGFVGLVLGGVNPTGDNSRNLKNVRAEIAAINLQLKDAGTPQGDIAGIDGARLRARLAELEAIKKSLLEIQQREALALNDQYGTGRYKQASGPDAEKIRLTPSGAGTGAKGAKTPKLDEIMTPVDKQYLEEMKRQAAEIATFVTAQQDSINELNSDIAADQETQARRLEDLRAQYIDLIDPVEQYRKKLEEIRELSAAGLLSPDQAAEAEFAIQQQIAAAAGFGEELKKVASEMDIFLENAARGFQESLSDFLFDPFADGLDGMLKGFGEMLRRMAAEAIAADITRAIFGNTGAAGGGQNILGGIAKLFGFASGGAFTVGGAGGTDSKLVAFKATPGEQVVVRTPQQQRAASGGGIVVQMTVNTPDAASFRRSVGQIQADLAQAVSGARRYT